MKKNKHIVSIVIFCLLAIVPVAAGFIFSFLNSIGVAGYFSEGFTLGYWKDTWIQGEIKNSLLYSASITSAVILVSLAFAITLQNKSARGLHTGASSYIFYIPLAIPYIVAAFLTYQFLNNSGVAARILYAMHIISSQQQFPDMVNDTLGLGIIITHIILATTFFNILFDTIYKNEKLNELKMVSYTLGSGDRYFFRHVLIPVLLRRALPSIILYSIFVFGSYEIPLILGGQDPQMISVVIGRKFQKYNLLDIPVAYTMATMYTALIIGVLILIYRFNKKFYESHW